MPQQVLVMAYGDRTGAFWHYYPAGISSQQSDAKAQSARPIFNTSLLPLRQCLNVEGRVNEPRRPPPMHVHDRTAAGGESARFPPSTEKQGGSPSGKRPDGSRVCDVRFGRVWRLARKSEIATLQCATEFVFVSVSENSRSPQRSGRSRRRAGRLPGGRMILRAEGGL